jgi:hypothetical protein
MMQTSRTVSAPWEGKSDQGSSAVRNSNPEMGVTRIRSPDGSLPPPHVSGPLHAEGNLNMTTGTIGPR